MSVAIRVDNFTVRSTLEAYMSAPLGFLITFTTYGTHLHGDERGSTHRQDGKLSIDLYLQKMSFSVLRETPFTLTSRDREMTVDAVQTAIAHRGWGLSCIHARTNHVHAVIHPGIDVDRALGYLKARATHALKSVHPERHRFWTQHGSTRYLWNRDQVLQAVDYVANRQGDAMSLHVSEVPESLRSSLG